MQSKEEKILIIEVKKFYFLVGFVEIIRQFFGEKENNIFILLFKFLVCYRYNKGLVVKFEIINILGEIRVFFLNSFGMRRFFEV